MKWKKLLSMISKRNWASIKEQEEEKIAPAPLALNKKEMNSQDKCPD